MTQEMSAMTTGRMRSDASVKKKNERDASAEEIQTSDQVGDVFLQKRLRDWEIRIHRPNRTDVHFLQLIYFDLERHACLNSLILQ